MNRLVKPSDFVGKTIIGVETPASHSNRGVLVFTFVDGTEAQLETQVEPDGKTEIYIFDDEA